MRNEIPCETPRDDWPGPEIAGIQLRQCPRAFVADVPIGRLYALWRHWQRGALRDALGGSAPSELLLEAIIWLDDAWSAWQAETMRQVHG